jgi:hypothetical protein
MLNIEISEHVPKIINASPKSYSQTLIHKHKRRKWTSLLKTGYEGVLIRKSIYQN